MSKRSRLSAALRRTVAFCIVLSITLPSALAQTLEEQRLRQPPVIRGERVIDETERLQLARVNRSYPVTPGDVYRITYQRAGTPVTMTATVESDYAVNLDLFGIVNGANKTFGQLRSEIQRIVDAAIPRSLPSVTLVTLGVFPVRIVGEVAQTRTVTAWGLSRLSDVVRDNLEAYSSVRSVTVIPENGTERNFDLFRAIDTGDVDQDPYVRPGDTVRIERAGRVVYIGGEVNRPGRLELTEDETIEDVLRYARGVTRDADLSRVRVTRSEDRTARTRFLDLDDSFTNIIIRDGDVLIIPSVRTQQPVVFVEELSLVPGLEGPPPEQPQTSRLVVPIGLGETLHGVLRRVQGDLSRQANLRRGTLVRDGELVRLGGTFEQLLYAWDESLDVELRPFDRIIIPRDRAPDVETEEDGLVLITGGVNAPGLYPVIPGAGAYTHIQRAGGFNRELNSREEFRVFDARGQLKPDNLPVEAGDHIEVMRNSFVYNYNRYFPIIATGVGFMATIVATLTLFGL